MSEQDQHDRPRQDFSPGLGGNGAVPAANSPELSWVRYVVGLSERIGDDQVGWREKFMLLRYINAGTAAKGAWGEEVQIEELAGLVRVVGEGFLNYQWGGDGCERALTFMERLANEMDCTAVDGVLVEELTPLAGDLRREDIKFRAMRLLRIIATKDGQISDVALEVVDFLGDLACEEERNERVPHRRLACDELVKVGKYTGDVRVRREVALCLGEVLMTSRDSWVGRSILMLMMRVACGKWNDYVHIATRAADQWFTDEEVVGAQEEVLDVMVAGFEVGAMFDNFGPAPKAVALILEQIGRTRSGELASRAMGLAEKYGQQRRQDE